MILKISIHKNIQQKMDWEHISHDTLSCSEDFVVSQSLAKLHDATQSDKFLQIINVWLQHLELLRYSSLQKKKNQYANQYVVINKILHLFFFLHMKCETYRI